jgi:hypothetical protein
MAFATFRIVYLLETIINIAAFVNYLETIINKAAATGNNTELLKKEIFNGVAVSSTDQSGAKLGAARGVALFAPYIAGLINPCGGTRRRLSRFDRVAPDQAV